MLLTLEPNPEQIKEQKLYQQMGLSDEEFTMIESILGRTPNYTETGLFSVMWSEHCSYKNSKPVLKRFPTSGERVLQGPGEGAGIVDIGDGQAVVFKIESHNHPSAIEPYQGAATGVGGIIRDVFSMGARPIAMLNSLRFGELDTARVRYLFKEVVAGIAGYGNCIGIPTVGGEVQFDPSYDGNPLVNAMCVGLINHEDIKKGQAHGLGNTVMYVGAKTGRDGIHGATFASEELTEQSDENRPAVQVGDPFMEKLLLEACLELIHSDALVGIQDMGAAGLASSSSEMASKAGMGIEMNLDLVPQRETGMTAYEMMLSESQERMLIVVKKGREQEIKDLFSKYDLEAVAIGKVTDDKQFRLFHKGEVVADLPVDALAEDAPVYHKPSKEPAYFAEFQAMENEVPKVNDLKDTLLKLLSQPTIASKEWVYEQYDYMVRTNTVVSPGSDAAVTRIRGTRKALAMTTDCNSRYVYLDPETGGKIAVAEAARNIVCSGAEPLAITDNLNFGNPEKPEVFWQIEKSADGISEACRVLETPVIGGNVSLYNETSGTAIYPTPVIGMVGLITDLDHITTQHFKTSGDLIYLVGETKPEFGGSELQKLLNGKISGKAPELNIEMEKERQRQVLAAIRAGLIQSAHDLSEGGLAVALSECLFAGEGLGADVNITGDSISALFSETQSRFLLSVKKEHQAEFESLVDASLIGEVNESAALRVLNGTVPVLESSVDELKAAWKGGDPMLAEIKGLNEECGIFGVFGHQDAAQLTYYGLHSLQHRGQEGTGIVVSDGKTLKGAKGEGLVAEIFTEEAMSQLTGSAAIGHVRYATAGGGGYENVQPLLFHSQNGSLALAHNGNLVNANYLKHQLEAQGSIFQTSSDTEVLAHLIRRSGFLQMKEQVKNALSMLKGAYAYLIMTETELMVALDPHGLRPLSLGCLGDAYVVASETCAFDVIGAEYIRDIMPGELLIINENGLMSERFAMSSTKAICMMEYVYFSRPDSNIQGVNVHTARKKLGKRLAIEAPIDADVVTGVPDSSISAAIGYAEATGIPYEMGLIKNKYVGRTFIQPSQSLREQGVKMKLSPVRGVVEGKRVIMVDDSIVRGTTSRRIVTMLKDAGATEVHVVISSPPIKNPCFYGIDTSSKEELIASDKSVEEIRQLIGADSLTFLSEAGLVKALDPEGINGFCLGCFNGNYPTEIYPDTLQYYYQKG